MSRLKKYGDAPNHFITINIKDNIWAFQFEKCCKITVDNLVFYRKKFEFKLYAYCIMPWHIHLLLGLINPKFNIQDVMRDFKSYSAKQILRYLEKIGQHELLDKFLLNKKSPAITHWGSPSTLRGSAGALAPAVVNNTINTPTHQQGLVGYPDRNKIIDQKQKTKILNKHRTPSKYQLWQDDFYDFNVGSTKKFKEKIHYINFNAEHHNLVKDPEDWKYSSYHNYYGCQHSLPVDVEAAL